MTVVRRLTLICVACTTEKPLDRFAARDRRCRECNAASARQRWSALPKEERQARSRAKVERRKLRGDVSEYRRSYVDRNRAKIMENHRAYYARRFFWAKSIKLRGKGKATAEQLARLWKAQRGCCALTGRRLDRTAQVDHKLPRARGGGDAATNLQWLCADANYAKRALTDAEFVALCSDVLEAQRRAA